MAKIFLHSYDLPADVTFPQEIAIDTEAMGLIHHRDRLCVVQIGDGQGHAHLVHFPTPDYSKAHNLKALLSNPDVTKIFHFARFDLAKLIQAFDIMPENIFCTKVASFLTRTYANKHGLRDLCKELLEVEISKQEQSSDWGAPVLSPAQQKYAAGDVLHLHKLKARFTALLEREGKADIARACFEFLPYRAKLDLIAGEEFDIFAHSVS